MRNQKNMIVGLTGQTGAGKSTLSQMFADRGVEIINADEVARVTMETSTACLMDLVLEYTTEVIHPDATLNRARLAEICFGNKQKLRKLNEITFPYIIEAITHKLEEACEHGADMVVLDAPTLYESGLDRRCDRVIAIIAARETRLARIMARDEMTEEAAMRRINAQNEDAFYLSRAHEVIVNDEDLDALKFSFMDIYGKLEQLAKSGAFAGMTVPDAEETAGTDAEAFGELASANE